MSRVVPGDDKLVHLSTGRDRSKGCDWNCSARTPTLIGSRDRYADSQTNRTGERAANCTHDALPATASPGESRAVEHVRLSSLPSTFLCYDFFRSRGPGFTEIAVRGVRQPIRLRNGTSDFDAFRQVYLQSQYALPELASARYVVDAGANIGLTSAYILSRNPMAQVIAIEPDIENYRIAAHILLSLPIAAT